MLGCRQQDPKHALKAVTSDIRRSILAVLGCIVSSIAPTGPRAAVSMAHGGSPYRSNLGNTFSLMENILVNMTTRPSICGSCTNSLENRCRELATPTQNHMVRNIETQ